MTKIGDMLHQMGGTPVGGEFTTGSIFFVHHSGSNSNDGTDKDFPLATLTYAITQTTASKGDIIYLMPAHAETTTAIVANVAGLDIRGLGHGAVRPTITATTGASDLIDVTAASFHMDNVILKGTSSGCTALIDLSAAADNFWLTNCSLEGAATPTALLTITPTADAGIIEDCFFTGAAGLAKCIAFENSTTSQDTIDWIIRRCIFNATTAAGCDDAMIEFSVSSGGVTGILIEDCAFLGLADGDHAINTYAAGSGRGTGLVNRCVAHGADATDAYVVSDMLSYVHCYATEAGTSPVGSTVGSGMMPVATSGAAGA